VGDTLSYDRKTMTSPGKRGEESKGDTQRGVNKAVGLENRGESRGRKKAVADAKISKRGG